MKKILSILFLLCAIHAQAVNQISATITITNAPTNGYTLTVNGDVRTWTNTITTNASQFLLTNSISGDNTNMFSQISSFPYASGVQMRPSSTNVIILTARAGDALAVTSSTNWASIALVTNVVTTLIPVRIPVSGEPTASQRTNIANGIVDALNSYGSTAIASNAAVLVNYVGTNTVQTISNKTIVGGSITNTAIGNGTNYGAAFSSSGGTTFSESFGAGSSTPGIHGTALGHGATAGTGIADADASAFGYSAIAAAAGDTVFGSGANTTGTSGGNNTVQGYLSLVTSGQGNTLIGENNQAAATSSLGIGVGIRITHDNAILIGNGLTSTRTNQIIIGDNTYQYVIPGEFVVSGNIASNFNVTGNATLNGTNRINSSLAYTRKDNSSLANGNNAAMDISTNINVRITSGPSGAFSICGIAGGTDGRIVELQNDTAQVMTIANASGADPTAANRILTGTGADITVTNSPGFVSLKYSTASNRWCVQWKSN